MKQSTKKTLMIWGGILLLAVAAFWIFIGSDKVESSKYMEESYKVFCQKVESGEIKSVTIKDDYLYYDYGDSLIGEETVSVKGRTINPESPNLKEFLLKNECAVKEVKSTDEIFTIVTDIIFYGIFICIFAFIFVKFISPNTFKVVHKTGKTFDDVVGMDKLKTDMKQIMDIMQHPGLYAKKGIRMPKGVILEGDPGNGKTLFAKALAGEAKVNFIPAKATDFESMFMAIGPMKVKLLFKKARRRAPCIVFIDEFDGIGTKRNYSGSAIETENTRIVTALLNELDGFQNTEGVLVVAATNSIEALDPALIRPGRFDARVSVPYPDSTTREKLIKMYTREKQIPLAVDLQTLVKKFNGFSCASIESSINKAYMNAELNKHTSVSLEDFE